VRRLAATLVLGAMLVAASAAAAPSPANRARLDRTVRYLQDAQQAEGGFAAAGEPSQIASAWVALALAAAGINPQDQAQPGGVDAYTFLTAHYRQGIEESDCAPIACTTTFERELMVVNAAATSPHDFGGVDLVSELLARGRPDGSFPHVPGGQPGVNDTIFAIFALAPIQEAAAQAPIQDAADWIEAVQRGNGGWAWSAGSSLEEVDMTGAAVQALIAAGRGGDEAVREGIAYLRGAQNPDGGFPQFPGESESNVASTAWAVQAIWAAGENPEAWLTDSGGETKEPLDYMESLQEPDGHVRWKRSVDSNGVWMTAYVAPAFAGQAWPIPAAPRSIVQPAAPAQPGEGGSQSGAGVIAGGGGNGAPLFSRPKPQSKGKTPGGARVVHPAGARPIDHSEVRRGANPEQPAGTATSEASASPGRAGAFAGSGSRGHGPAAATGSAVSGTLVGSAESGHGGSSAFGAPGLHSAGSNEERWLAIGIGACALLLVVWGAQLERRCLEAIL
jgi:prenyltransferase beta subunit